MCGPKDYQTIDEALETKREGVSVQELDAGADLTRPASKAKELLGDAITNGDNFLVARITPGEDGAVKMDGVTTVDDMQLIMAALQHSLRAALDTLAASR